MWRFPFYFCSLLCLPPLAHASAADTRQAFADGVIALDNGDPNRARELLTQVTRAAPDWDLAFLELGLAEEKLAETNPAHQDAARQALEKAVQLSPSNPRANFELAVCYQALQRYQDALAPLQKAVQLRPRWVDAWLRLGEVHGLNNDPNSAIATYAQAAQLPNGLVPAETRLAELFETQKDIQQAEQALLTIVHAQPSVPYFHYQLAEFYQRNSMPVKAQDAFERAKTLDPRQPQRKMRKLRKSKR